MAFDRKSRPEETLASFARSGVSRRQFMERALAVGLAVPAATGIWSSAARAQQQPGGHIVAAVHEGETSDTLEIGAAGGAHNQTIKESVTSKLVGQRNDGGLEPELATDWEASEGGRVWSFRLREGVEFHNGKTLDTDDVIASMNYHRGENTTSGGATYMKPVTDVRADGNVVVFELEEATADFPYYLSQRMFNVAPLVDGKLDQSGMGTGAFVLEEFEPGVRGVGRRNPNYYKNGLPYFDSFELLSVKDATTLSNGLMTGTLHAIFPVDPKTAALLDRAPDIDVVSVKGGAMTTMPMHADKAPFDNVDFRQALKWAMNRTELAERVFQGHAALGNDHPVAPFDQFYNADLPQRDMDLDRARFHLQRSGMEGANIRLHAADAAFVGSVDAGLLFSESARQIGVNIEVVREPNDGYWSNVWRNVPFCYSFWGARPTPDLILSVAYVCDAAWGDTNWCNEQLTSVVREARVTLDPALRRELYGEAQRILHEEGSTIVPMFMNLIHGISSQIDTGGELLGAQPLDTYRAFQKWSFKA
jgi:peptide/nickel transport system substrate-binding protein